MQTHQSVRSLRSPLLLAVIIAAASALATQVLAEAARPAGALPATPTSARALPDGVAPHLRILAAPAGAPLSASVFVR